MAPQLRGRKRPLRSSSGKTGGATSTTDAANAFYLSSIATGGTPTKSTQKSTKRKAASHEPAAAPPAKKQKAAAAAANGQTASTSATAGPSKTKTPTSSAKTAKRPGTLPVISKQGKAKSHSKSAPPPPPPPPEPSPSRSDSPNKDEATDNDSSDDPEPENPKLDNGPAIDPKAWYSHAVGLEKAAEYAQRQIQNLAGEKDALSYQLRTRMAALAKCILSGGTVHRHGDLSEDMLQQFNRVVGDSTDWVDGLESSLRADKAKGYIKSIAGFLVPQAMLVLVSMLRYFGERPFFSDTQISRLSSLTKVQRRFHEANDRLRDSLSSKERQTSLNVNKKSVLKLADQINSRFKPFAQIIAEQVKQRLRRVQQEKEAQRQRSERAERQRLQALEDAYDAKIQTWRKNWQYLHDVRRQAEMANGRFYLPPAAVAHLRDIPVQDVALKGLVQRRIRRLAQRLAASITASDAVELDSAGRPIERVDMFGRSRPAPQPAGPQVKQLRVTLLDDSWTPEQDRALHAALRKHADSGDKVWAFVVWNLCRAQEPQGPGSRKRIPGVLADFNVSEIVDRGVHMARCCERDDLMNGKAPESWTAVTDPRIAVLTVEEMEEEAAEIRTEEAAAQARAIIAGRGGQRAAGDRVEWDEGDTLQPVAADGDASPQLGDLDAHEDEDEDELRGTIDVAADGEADDDEDEDELPDLPAAPRARNAPQREVVDVDALPDEEVPESEEEEEDESEVESDEDILPAEGA